VRTLRGIPASRGIVVGPAFRLRARDLRIERAAAPDRGVERERFQSALQEAQRQLAEVRARAAADSGEEEAAIFETHALMLEDPELIERVESDIAEHGVNAEAALHDAVKQYARVLAGLDDEYLRARAADVRDVARRVLRILVGYAESPTEGLRAPSIILARDLSPSDTVMLDKSLVLGFATAEGGATSHTAILARSLGLPAVVGAGPGVLELLDATSLVLDGGDGVVLVEPPPEVVRGYNDRQSAAAEAAAGARRKARQPAVTCDGHRVEIAANVGSVADAHAAVEAGAEGVGLLRTEFLYLERTQIPDEEEQYQAYRAIARVFGEQPVVLRTLDAGGDKDIPYLGLPAEANPFLGQRAIRLCLARPELFQPQLRAALRAGAGGNLKLMFPMVATLAELRAARVRLAECRAALVAEGSAVAETMEIGIMIEVPAAAVLADRFAPEVDFFSIGTNDLSQYTLAADRTNARVSGLANALHPAVLRLVRGVVDAAHAHGKWVGVCGELAGEPLAIPVLLGLGVDELSMSAPAIPAAKEIVRSLDLRETRALAEKALQLDDADEVEALVSKAVALPR
jgi:phosphoenolpyruvate-protein phosphotransferase (PTS system enzyme I)